MACTIAEYSCQLWAGKTARRLEGNGYATKAFCYDLIGAWDYAEGQCAILKPWVQACKYEVMELPEVIENTQENKSLETCKISDLYISSTIEPNSICIFKYK